MNYIEQIEDKAYVRHCADRLSYICRQMEELSAEKSGLEAYFLTLAGKDLKNVKYKTVTYTGSGATRVRVRVASEVKLLRPTELKKKLGSAFDDLIKVETEPRYTIKADGKRLFAAVANGEYIEDSSIEEVIRSAASDESAIKILLKKVRGKDYGKDIKNLMSLTGMAEPQAEETAYLASEAHAWELFERFAAGNEDKKTLLDTIASSVVVVETPKISVEV